MGMMDQDILKVLYTEEEIAALQRDIFTYSGLGCRNVSLIFAPQGFEFSLAVPQMPQGYTNNYRHARALMTMQGERFTDLGGAIAVEGEAKFPRHISCINIYRYTEKGKAFLLSLFDLT